MTTLLGHLTGHLRGQVYVRGAEHLQLQYISTLSHKRHNLLGKVPENNMCSLIFHTTLREIFSQPKIKAARCH
jgi:hypothetical protein